MVLQIVRVFGNLEAQLNIARTAIFSILFLLFVLIFISVLIYTCFVSLRRRDSSDLYSRVKANRVSCGSG